MRPGAHASAELVSRCAALGDDSRWQILQLLGSGPCSASELAGRLPISRQAIARHLGVLESVGLVEPYREGRQVRYRALGAELSALGARLQQAAAAWDQRLDRLKALAEGAVGPEV